MPYARGTLSQSQALDARIDSAALLSCCARRGSPISQLFERIAHRAQRAGGEGAARTVIVPAFVVGELRGAFAIGFALYLPFVAIDLAVAAMLMGLGMMMLSPPVVSLPVKLLLFVMVDGWALICGGVAASFR